MRLRFHIERPTIMCPRNVHALRDETLLAAHSLHVHLASVSAESVLIHRRMPGSDEGDLLCDQLAIHFEDLSVHTQLPEADDAPSQPDRSSSSSSSSSSSPAASAAPASAWQRAQLSPPRLPLAAAPLQLIVVVIKSIERPLVSLAPVQTRPLPWAFRCLEHSSSGG